jgi:hypothetical protein
VTSYEVDSLRFTVSLLLVITPIIGRLSLNNRLIIASITG